MTGLALALLRAQWRRVLTVFVLAMLAVAAAVAAPVYADMAGRAIAAADVAVAPANQRTITATDFLLLKAEPDNPGQEYLVAEGRRRDFEHVAPTLLQTPGFSIVFAVSVPAFVSASAEIAEEKIGDLEFRESLCEHIVLVAGRCVGAPGEVVVSEARASAGLVTSSTAHVTAARYISGGPGNPGIWVPAGQTCRLAVVGVYRPRDASDPYWGGSVAALDLTGGEPLLTDRGTIAACDHEEETQELVAYPLPGTFTIERIDEVRAAVRSTVERARGRVPARTGIEGLLSTMESDRRTVALVPTTAAVPLLALCWFVLFLAIAFTAQARRRELGIVKLRGVSTGDQWTLAAAESLIPVLTGSAVGYLAGHVAVWGYGRIVFGPGVSAPLTTGPLPYAAVAVTGAVLAAAVALRRDLSATATDLLRRVPARTVRWGDLTLAGLLGVAAVAAVVQLRSDGSTPRGLGLLAPALVLLTLGLLCGVALDPVAARVGARAVHTGRIGLAMAALHIGRRRTASRLLAVVVVAVGLLIFAAAAAQAAQDARTSQVSAGIGATRVLSVSEVRPAQLLHAVRMVDPDAAFAMAVVGVDAGRGGRMLAVDAAALSRTALWPAANGDLTVADAAAALRPAMPAPIIVRGTDLSVSADVGALEVSPDLSSLHLEVTVTPVNGSASVTRDLGQLRPGNRTYPTDVSCQAGCRLSGLAVAPNGPVDGSFRLTVTSIDQGGTRLASGPELGGWRVRNAGVLQTRATSGGLELSATSSAFQGPDLRLVPPDTAVPLPVLDVAPATAPTLDLASGDRIEVVRAGEPRYLPRLGTGGALVDLDYLGRLGDLAVASRSGEIWLGPDAPPDAADRFRAAGMTVAGERRMADELAAAARRPSAAGVRFLLVVAGLGLLLGAAGLTVAADVERPIRTDELRALRTQGLSPGQVRLAAGLGYAGLVTVAAALGGVCAAVVWLLTGDRLPLVDSGPAVAVSLGPGLTALATGAAGSAVLVLIALILAAVLTRTVERSSSVDGSAR